MTANLIANYPRDEAERLLEASFAAFQRAGDIADTEKAISALEHQLAKEEQQASCDRGSVDEYLASIEAAVPRRRQDGIKSTLGPGSVVDIVGGSRDGRYAVLKRLSSKDGGSRYLVLSTTGRVSTLGYKQITDPSRLAGSIELPSPFKPRDRRFVQQTVKRLRKIPQPNGADTSMGHMLVDHPVAECPDAERHLSALRRANRVRRKLDQHRRLHRSSGGMAWWENSDRSGIFSKSLTTWRVGRLLRVVDVSVAFTTRLTYFWPSRLSVAFSTDSNRRRSQPLRLFLSMSHGAIRTHPLSGLLPYSILDGSRSRNCGKTSMIARSPFGWHRPDDPTRDSVCWAYQWAAGMAFDDLPTRGMAPGDFVRVSRQLADLLRQLRESVVEMRDECSQAVDAVDRRCCFRSGCWLMPRWLVTVNRAAGRKPTPVGDVRDALDRVGVDAEIVVPDSAEETTAAIRTAALDGKTHFAVAGRRWHNQFGCECADESQPRCCTCSGSVVHRNRL